tara:strand:+ start:110 stop:334 length:225 start_codon:yes stop_codon:yes gene_type:complete
MDKIYKNKFKSNLSLLQYKVTQEGATEPPFHIKVLKKVLKFLSVFVVDLNYLKLKINLKVVQVGQAFLLPIPLK